MTEYQNIELIFKVNAGNLALQKRSDEGNPTDVSLSKLTQHFLMAACQACFPSNGVLGSSHDGDYTTLLRVDLGGKSIEEKFLDLDLALSKLGAHIHKDEDTVKDNVRTSRITINANMGALGAAL